MALSKRKKRFLYILGGIVLIVSALLAAAYNQFADVERLKSLAVLRLEEMTGRKVSVGVAELEFFQGISVRLHNVSVGGRYGGSPEFTARSVWVVVKPLPLLDKRIEIQKVIVQGSSFVLIRNSSGEFNFADLKTWISRPHESNLFNVLQVGFMHQMSVREGSIQFFDYYQLPEGAEPLHLSVENINLSVHKKFLNTPFRFFLSAEVPNLGGPTFLNLSGTVDDLPQNGSRKDITFHGKVKIQELNVSRFGPYLKPVAAALRENTWLSMESTFSGSLDGRLESEGKVHYSEREVAGEAALRAPESIFRGILNYHVLFDRDTLEFKDLELHSVAFQSRGQGKLSGLFSGNPRVSLAVETGEFLIDQSETYPPLALFPAELHKRIQSRFQGGTVEIKSLKFDGTLKELENLSTRENQNLLSADLALRQVNWRSPLPDFQKVTGTLKMDQGNSTFHIHKANYEGLPLSDINGTIQSLLFEPFADLEVENRVDMAEFKAFLTRILGDDPFVRVLKKFHKIKGTGLVTFALRGPLMEGDEIALSGHMTLDDVSVEHGGFRTRLEKISGKVEYQDPPLSHKQNKGAVSYLKFDDFSGRFGHSGFSNLNGKLVIEKDRPHQELAVVYSLSAEDFPDILRVASSDPKVKDFVSRLAFSSGRVEVAYNSKGDGQGTGQEESWGRVNLKDVSVRYDSRFQPLLNVTGTLNFDKKRTFLSKVHGWLGDSPFDLEGEVVWSGKSEPDYHLSVSLPQMVQENLQDVPFLERIRFSGPAALTLKLDGNPKSLRFENRIDLTHASYQYGTLYKKNSSLPNRVFVKGSFAQDERIDIEKFVYELEGEKVEGHGRIVNLNDPAFNMNLRAKDFKVTQVGRFIEPLQSAQGGTMDFSFKGKGKIDQFEKADFTGTVQFKNLVLKPAGLANEINIDARVDCENHVLKIRKASLVAENTRVDFLGEFQKDPSPLLNLEVSGDDLVLSELIPSGEQEGLHSILDTPSWLSGGKVILSLNLNRLDYKSLTLKNILGKVWLHGKVLEIPEMKLGKQKPILVRAIFNAQNPEATLIQAKVQGQQIESAHIMGMFEEVFHDGLTGKVENLLLDVRGRGKGWDGFLQSITGNISFHLKDGTWNKMELARGGRRLIGKQVEEPPATAKKPDSPGEVAPLEKEESEPYERISADFTLAAGIAETENFIVATPQRKISIVGKFDLGRQEMDTVLGVAPLPGLDKFLTKIPVVGKIITAGDEESLVKTYYSVKGPFHEPEVSPIPFVSLGKKVMGIFQGILQTPQEIFTLPQEKVTN